MTHEPRSSSASSASPSPSTTSSSTGATGKTPRVVEEGVPDVAERMKRGSPVTEEEFFRQVPETTGRTRWLREEEIGYYTTYINKVDTGKSLGIACTIIYRPIRKT